MKNTVEEALKDLRAGKIVLVFDSDDRERETDMVVASEFITPKVVMEMRKEAGGLICTAAHNDIKEKFDLPFLVDVFSCSAKGTSGHGPAFTQPISPTIPSPHSRSP